MKNYLRTILGLCIIMLLFFTVNALGVGTDASGGSLIISKADTKSDNVQFVNALIIDNKSKMLNNNPTEVSPVARPITNTEMPKGPGAAALVVLAFALIILVSSRQRRV